MELPVRAEVAFALGGGYQAEQFTEALKQELLTRITGAFRGQAVTGTVRGPGTPAIVLEDASGRPLQPGQPDKGAGALGGVEMTAAALLAIRYRSNLALVGPVPEKV